MNKKTILLGALLMFSAHTFCQTTLDGMSARAKSKLAKQEERDAKKDDAYQSLMEEGHTSFEANDFEAALNSFEQASSMRPVNVYPPVMIADVKLAMENYVEPEDTASIEEEPILSEPEVAELPEVTTKEDDIARQERLKEAYEREMQKVQDEAPAPIAEAEPETPLIDTPAITEVPIEEQKTDSEGMIEFTDEDPQVVLAGKFPDGVTEEEFEEGNKVILRRVVVKDGVANDYRRVTHAWGGVFYFKNGESVTLRTWNQETVLD